MCMILISYLIFIRSKQYTLQDFTTFLHFIYSNWNKSVFSYLRTLTMWHCPHSAATAAAWIDISCPPGPQQQTGSQSVCCSRRLVHAETDGWKPHTIRAVPKTVTYLNGYHYSFLYLHTTSADNDNIILINIPANWKQAITEIKATGTQTSNLTTAKQIERPR